MLNKDAHHCLAQGKLYFFLNQMAENTVAYMSSRKVLIHHRKVVKLRLFFTSPSLVWLVVSMLPATE